VPGIPWQESAMQIDRLSFKKIFFHIDKIHEYQTTGDAFPVHMLVGFTDYCNHDCIWCYTAYSTHDNFMVMEDGTRQTIEKKRDDRVVDADVLLRFLRDAKSRGLSSIKIVGSGEPILHPQSAEMMKEIGEMGIDFGVLGNGQLLKEEHFEALMQYATFFRFSLDAADAETYKKLHGPSARFDKVIENLKRLVQERKDRKKILPTIGVQYVVSQYNVDGMEPFVQLIREIGADYVVFKPMYDNLINVNRAKNTLPVEAVLQKLRELKPYETEHFSIYDKGGEQFRLAWSPQRTNNEVYYKKCMAHQFVPSVYANGNLYICPNLAGRKEFVLGNIYENTLEEIWRSPKRKKAVESIDLCGKCPARCYLDPLNRILWDISNPDPAIHPTFL
ncbi:MAG: radical SAM protein, partial [Candidatus Omnitrophota bacterium]